MRDACVDGDAARVEQVLEAGEHIDAESADHETALTFAIVWNQPELVSRLLALGANPEAPAQSPWSPLMYAASEGSIECVRALLRAGADRSREDEFGRTAAEVAESANQPDAAGFIRTWD
jgi:ankyrin repeat protein